MTWFRVDDQFALHPKAIAAGNSALGLWVRAGSWCSAHLTDGALPAHMVGTLGAQRRDARKLITVGLWCETPDGYQFNDWHHYQATKEQVKADREAARIRQQRHREQQRHAVTDGVTSGVTNGVSHDTHPIPSHPSSGLGSQSTNGHRGTGPDLTKIAKALDSDEQWAAKVVADIRGRAGHVKDVTAYVLTAIASEPARYRPTLTAPRPSELCPEHARDRATCPPAWHKETP